MPKKVYNDEHFSWIALNFNNYQNSVQMAMAFESRFSIPMTAQKMRAFYARLNLHRNSQNSYTLEQDEWLKKHHETKSYSNLVKDFNAEFNTNVTSQSIYQRCWKYLKLKYQDPERFNNNIAWNKMPIGTERNSHRGIMIKAGDDKWIKKARYVYEKYKGEVEKSCQIIQLDGDKNNFSLENLVKVPTKYMVMLNRNNWLGKAEVSRTAIKLCELFYVM